MFIKKYRLWFFVPMFLLCQATYANWFQDIINAINAQGNITNNWLSGIYSQQASIAQNEQEIGLLMKQVNGHLEGVSGQGTFQFHDYQSYGTSANDWAGVLNMADGPGDGPLGDTINTIKQQFPIDQNTFNNSTNNLENQNYYALKSKTILAARAASELDYNKIQDQIAYQQMLMQHIESTQDLKAAVDFSNRVQVEGNLINLEILRQVALANQQQAVNEQANVNAALANAKFLTKN